jgi:hypothetical protein
MIDLDTAKKWADLAVTIIGAGLVATYWSWRQHVLEQYRYLDASYADLLRLYRENPDFGDAGLTCDYLSHFDGDRRLKYHYFARTVHTVMETVFDLSRADRLAKLLPRIFGRRRRPSIPKEWSRIFAYHTRLHSEWLKQNREANEPRYVEYVLGPNQ